MTSHRKPTRLQRPDMILFGSIIGRDNSEDLGIGGRQ
jgi:hypothetical protein